MKLFPVFSIFILSIWLTSNVRLSAFDNIESTSLILRSEFIFEDAPFASCHASTIAETTDGTLVAAWFGGSREGAGDVAIWSSYLEKGSERWSAPIRVGTADEENTPCWNPVLFQPKDERLCLFYKQGKQISQWQGVLLFSDDNGKTWTDRRILPEYFIGPVKNKPVQLNDGTILCASSSEHNGWKVHFEFIPAFDKTWSRTEAINDINQVQAIQPTILKHKNGSLQAICRNRNGNGNLLSSWSDDNGKTWSKLTDLGLPNPNSGVDAVTLKDGRFLLVYNHSNINSGGRNVLNIAVSDDGIEWKAVVALENDEGEFSYPSVIQSKEGLVHIVYTWKRKKIRRVSIDPQKIMGVPITNGIWPDSVQ